jgi:hypothetical protein
MFAFYDYLSVKIFHHFTGSFLDLSVWIVQPNALNMCIKRFESNPREDENIEIKKISFD